MSQSILLSDPDKDWMKKTKDFLDRHQYDVDISHSGKDCQLNIYKNKYIGIILDIDVKNHSGLEVLKYIRFKAPYVKVILTISNRKRLEELGLTKDELRKLGASDILVKPYSLDALKKSLEGENQFEAWKNVKASIKQHDEEPVSGAHDAEFTRIKIGDFFSGNTTIFDYYVRLGKDKYVKILHKGDFFESARLKKYETEKKVEHLYFKTKERSMYINFINKILGKIAVSSKVSTEKKVGLVKNLTTHYVEEIYTSGLKPQLISEGRDVCQHIHDIIRKEPKLNDILNQYGDYDPSAFSHVFLVSFFSTVICQNLDWAWKKTTMTVAFGALLHDIGMLKMPQSIRDCRVKSMTPDQLELYQQHPFFGMEMLQKYSPLITEQIKQIVYQHHEMINGEGFPNGLTGIRIYPPAKVVALANEFAHILTDNRLTPLAGLKKLISDRGRLQRFDPMVIKSLVFGFMEKMK